jgi:hypothetical protein
MVTAIWQMSKIRRIQLEDKKEISDHIPALDGFIYAIYLMTILGEPLVLSISYMNTVAMVMIYITATSIVIYFYAIEIFLYYLFYMPAWVFYTQIVIFVVERKSKIGFLQD